MMGWGMAMALIGSCTRISTASLILQPSSHLPMARRQMRQGEVDWTPICASLLEQVVTGTKVATGTSSLPNAYPPRSPPCSLTVASSQATPPGHRELFIDNLLVRIHSIIEMILWTGLAPWEFKSPFPGSFISAFLGPPNTLPDERLQRRPPCLKCTDPTGVPR